MSADIMHH